MDGDSDVIAEVRAIRDAVDDLIQAILDSERTIMPADPNAIGELAKSLEAQSKEYEARAETRNVLTEAALRGADMGKAIAYMDAATQVRKALP